MQFDKYLTEREQRADRDALENMHIAKSQAARPCFARAKFLEIETRACNSVIIDHEVSRRISGLLKSFRELSILRSNAILRVTWSES